MAVGKGCTVPRIGGSVVALSVLVGLATASPARPAVDWGQLSLVFEPNLGQTAEVVQYVARTPGHQVFATEEGLVLKVMEREGPLVPERRLPAATEKLELTKEREKPVKVAVVRLKLVRGAGKLRWQGEERQASYSNYFLGNDPSKWRVNVPHYARVVAREALAGVDWVLRGNGRQLQYDFVVAPGADAGGLELEVEGAEKIASDEEGNLRLFTAAGVVVQKAPLAYQEEGSKRVVRESRWQVKGRRLQLAVGVYDRSKPLVVDPVSLVYSTYLGGTVEDYAYALAVDSSGAAYVAGLTDSIDFPTQNPFQGSHLGGSVAFVAKLSPSGNSLVYSTYLGGWGSEFTYALAVDNSGAAYVAGETLSTNFPTQNPFQGSNSGSWDAFVAKLSPAGNSLVYSTYLGGGAGDWAEALAVDSSGAAYVAGETMSIDFPSQGPFQGSYAGRYDAFVAKFGPFDLSSTGVSCTPNPSTYGQAVTCTATVIGSSPTGTVDFVDGATSLCSGVPLVGGQASCTAGGLGAGSHTITANYSGDGNNAPSSGSTVQEVNPAPTTTVASSSPNPSTPAQVVTLTVTVTAQHGTIPTGTVNVVDSTTATTLCSSVPLNASGQASCATSALTTPGTHSVQATYGGDANHSGSSGSGSHQVQQPEAIPTLGQWGVLLLASLMVFAAWRTLRRGQQHG